MSSRDNDRVPAGNFSHWLKAPKGSTVPCGSCTACCRSSMFIHIAPAETDTLARIPRTLLFPAPGLPKGHRVMGFNDHGHCPLLIDEKCSIYVDRPETCRDYDCRAFAATGIPVRQPEIAAKVKSWKFDYDNQEARDMHQAVREAVAFLNHNRSLCPPGAIPAHPVDFAALALKIYARANPSGADIKAALADPDTNLFELALRIVRNRRLVRPQRGMRKPDPCAR